MFKSEVVQTESETLSKMFLHKNHKSSLKGLSPILDNWSQQIQVNDPTTQYVYDMTDLRMINVTQINRTTFHTCYYWCSHRVLKRTTLRPAETFLGLDKNL